MSNSGIDAAIDKLVESVETEQLVESIEAEQTEQPLNRSPKLERRRDAWAEVQALDKALRDEARTIAQSMVKFKELVVTAKAEGIHEALGFKSWPAYVSDVISKEMTKLPVDDRLQIVTLLAGEGMSNRAIAAAVGAAENTVRRDKRKVRQDDAPDTVITDPAPTVTGTDGKSYPAKRKPALDKFAMPDRFTDLPVTPVTLNPTNLDAEPHRVPLTLVQPRSDGTTPAPPAPAPLRSIDALVSEIASLVAELERHGADLCNRSSENPFSEVIDARKLADHPFADESVQIIEKVRDDLLTVWSDLGSAQDERRAWRRLTRTEKRNRITELEFEDSEAAARKRGANA